MIYLHIEEVGPDSPRHDLWEETRRMIFRPNDKNSYESSSEFLGTSPANQKEMKLVDERQIGKRLPVAAQIRKGLEEAIRHARAR